MIDRVETTSTVWLGLTMGCARCHDHKYDPISQKEFYQFFAFFNNVAEMGNGVGRPVNYPPVLKAPRPSDRQRLRELEAAVVEAEKTVQNEETQLSALQVKWEEAERAQPTILPEPADYVLRFPFDESVSAVDGQGEKREAVFHAGGTAQWVAGKVDRALQLDGKPNSYVDAGKAVTFSRNHLFSLGAWMKAAPRGAGTLIAKVDDAAGQRGFDLQYLNDGKIAARTGQQGAA